MKLIEALHINETLPYVSGKKKLEQIAHFSVIFDLLPR